MKKTKIIITAAIMAALVTATACGGKDQASTPTEAQTTTTAVKQVNSINTENTIDKQEATEASVENTASSNEEVLVAEAVTEENQGNSDSVEEINNTVPAAAEDINAAWTDTTPAEQPEENINSGWEDAAPVEQPAEAPVEDSNVGIVDTTPEEQPAAPAEPSPAPAPEPVVTPQAPAAPTLTDEERLVATGKWTKTDEGINPYTGKTYSNYECIDPLTGYKIGTVFSDGTLTGLYNNTKEEAQAIAQAHNCPNGITIEDLLTF
ncbi:MAG: hypothetical protein KHY45_11310 [Eubacterium sp.]|nr:hypothetical protein [Eubacterium sp.]